eukprot:1161667-Pelagomonas_calceolata.AAC.18
MPMYWQVYIQALIAGRCVFTRIRLNFLQQARNKNYGDDPYMLELLLLLDEALDHLHSFLTDSVLNVQLSCLTQVGLKELLACLNFWMKLTTIYSHSSHTPSLICCSYTLHTIRLKYAALTPCNLRRSASTSWRNFWMRHTAICTHYLQTPSSMCGSSGSRSTEMWPSMLSISQPCARAWHTAKV